LREKVAAKPTDEGSLRHETLHPAWTAAASSSEEGGALYLCPEIPKP